MKFNQSKYNKHWNDYKLNNLGEFSRGKSRHRPRDDIKLYEGGGYPLIQTGDITNAGIFLSNHTAEYGEFGLKQSRLWNEGTLCITIAANIAETTIIQYPMCFPDSVVGFNANSKSSEIFMYYIFEYIRKSIKSSVRGSIQDNINIEYLKMLDFKIPNKDYQDKVVSVLFSIDQKIQNNNKIIKELEDMAKTLYDYWFVQFDFPDENGKPYKSSGGKMVYSEELKREIPQGWEVSTVGKCLDKVPNTNRIDTSNYCETGKVPIIDQSKNYIAGFTGDKDAVITLDDGAIVFGDHTRVVKFISFDFARGADGTQVIISNDKERLPQMLFYQIIRSIDLSNYGYARHYKFLKDSKTIIPMANLSQLYDTIVKPEYSKIKDLILENQQLTSLRDWLLPMLMNGQAVVK